MGPGGPISPRGPTGPCEMQKGGPIRKSQTQQEFVADLSHPGSSMTVTICGKDQRETRNAAAHGSDRTIPFISGREKHSFTK